MLQITNYKPNQICRNKQKYKSGMNFIRRMFSRPSSGPKKPGRPDSPTNKVLKKIMFYGFLFFTTATIVSKKYKTNLIFTFEPTEQNKRIIEYNAVFHQGVYNPVYWMIFGPLQRFYAKYLEEPPYFRPTSHPATRELFETHELTVHDKYLSKENLSIALIVAGCEGLDSNVKKIMSSINKNGFKTICIRPDDFHSLQRLQNTVQNIKTHNPNSKIYALGIDYGANLLVNLASKNDKAVNGIASIGNPLNLQESEKKVQESNFIWKNLLYNDMVRTRIKTCEQNRALFGETLKINPQNTSLYDLDRECYNGPYEDYQALKQSLSSINQIKNLKVPSLFIQSQEDPFSISIEENQEKLQNSKCIFVESQRGGHTEWFESMKKIRWVTRPIVQFFKHLDGRI